VFLPTALFVSAVEVVFLLHTKPLPSGTKLASIVMRDIVGVGANVDVAISLSSVF